MRRISAGVYLVAFSAAAVSWAQAPSSATQKLSSPAAAASPASAPLSPPAAPPAPSGPAPVGPSAVLKPALDQVQATLNTVKLDKWKRGSVRDEAGADIGSVRSDMQVNLPPLLRDGDAAPGVLSKTIPVARNIDALYDVLLRVVEASRIAAPDDQANALRQSLAGLSSARLALYDKMQDAAAIQEKQVSDLRATVQKQAAFKCPAPPPAPVCPTPAPAKKRKPKPPAATTQPQQPQKPAAPGTGTPTKPGI